MLCSHLWRNSKFPGVLYSDLYAMCFHAQPHALEALCLAWVTQRWKILGRVMDKNRNLQIRHMISCWALAGVIGTESSFTGHCFPTSEWVVIGEMKPFSQKNPMVGFFSHTFTYSHTHSPLLPRKITLLSCWF